MNYALDGCRVREIQGRDRTDLSDVMISALDVLLLRSPILPLLIARNYVNMQIGKMSEFLFLECSCANNV